MFADLPSPGPVTSDGAQLRQSMARVSAEDCRRIMIFMSASTFGMLTELTFAGV
jgi:hypothetical protein